MDLNGRISAFSELGDFLRNFSEGRVSPGYNDFAVKLTDLIERHRHTNAWFTPENIHYAINQWGQNLSQEKLTEWLSPYLFPEKEGKTVAVIMAGNIPLVGMHDFLSVLVTGNSILIKPSGKDKSLPVFIAELLCAIEPRFNDRIKITDNIISGFDAIIATGSSDSSRYFDYYFSKYPNIIRKSRTSVAVLTGDETTEELVALGHDLFRYFGLGCRNVSKLYVPEGYSFTDLIKAVEPWQHLYTHNKWANNYDYHQSVYLMNRIPFIDSGFFMLKEDRQNSSPLSVIFYEHFSDICILAAELKKMNDQLQCVVSKSNSVKGSLLPGLTQNPKLNEYADDTDTIEFLCNL